MELTEVKNKTSKGLSLFDESFAGGNTGNMHLCIHVSTDGITCGVLEKGENKFIALETFTFQGVYGDEALKNCIEDVFTKSICFKRSDYKNVQVAIVNNKSNLVPVALYDDAHKKTYFTFNQELSSGEEIAVDTIKSLEAKNIYAVPTSIKNFFINKFSKPSFIHYSTALLDSLLTLYKNHSLKKVLVHVQLGHFEVIVAEGKNLLFYNTFNYTTAEDFMYYLLFVFEQLGLNPENQEIVLLGEIERNSTIYGLMLKYIRNVRFGERPENYSYSYKLSEAPKHFYYNLLSLPLCV